MDDIPELNRRTVLAAMAAAGAFGLDASAAAGTSAPALSGAAGGENVIRPFRVSVPEEQLIDLRWRLAATQWPDRETVTDQSQGVQLATMRDLAHYWGTDYDWRKCETKLNNLPQFITEIDALDIHY
jgi:hypothetical protein